ncbi:MAG: PulJ/GspJ family protein [Nitrospinaceae bacterium]|jgi:prepilin-type N-terminal cleavage/methylation domain-containing protein|tara:strand:- start:307 stop:1152 length:846 start_codon:yes stop_codon:yes gene_type:complete
MFTFRESNKGFTLLELVLSLSITGFIVAISLGAIRLGTTAQETGHLKTDTSQRIRLIQNQLGQKIKSNYPVFKFQEKNNSQKKPGRFLSFDGGNDYLRFVTFSSPLTIQGEPPWMHETAFYIGKHPQSGKSGIIMAERSTKNNNKLSSTLNNSDNEKIFLLAENVVHLKFRYYQMKKINPIESSLQAKNPNEYQGQWVTSVNQNNLFKKSRNITEGQSNFFNNGILPKISLPRAIEVSIGIKEPSRASPNSKSKIILSSPNIIPLYSGMKFALPLKDNENI